MRPVAAPQHDGAGDGAPTGAAASVAPAATASAPEPVVAASTPSAPASAPPASSEPDATAASPPGVDPRYRACSSDADCVAVRRAGCCYNGWQEAVAATQAAAYSQAYACTRTRRPACPMYIVRDTRVARCDAASHLCTMVKP